MIFSRSSKEKLLTCDDKIQLLFNEAILDSPIDFTIMCGHRGELEQNEAFANGYSKLKYPKGKHNKIPSQAIDVVPSKNKWDSRPEEWQTLAYHIKKTANRLNITIKWGGDWKSFIDLPHWEL